MAKLTISDVSSGYISVAALNDNFSKIEDAIENTLSRDGTAPNQMDAPIDMNGQRVYNLGRAISNTDALSLAQLLEYVDAGTVIDGVVPVTWSFTSTGDVYYDIPLASTDKVDMYIVSSNGVLISPLNYSISIDLQRITFYSDIPAVGETVVVRLFGKIPEASASGITINNLKKSYYFDVVGAETTFLTTASNNLDINATDVYLNGVKLIYEVDYTLSAKSVELISSATIGDKIEVVVTNSIVSVGDELASASSDAAAAALSASQAAASAVDAAAAGAAAGAAAWATGWTWSTITTGYTVSKWEGLFVDTTSSAFTVTLPSTADVGDKVQIVDVAFTFGINALTIGRNGLKIMGLEEDMVVTTGGSAFELVYSGSTYGWRVM
jgi:hypothetical protein